MLTMANIRRRRRMGAVPLVPNLLPNPEDFAAATWSNLATTETGGQADPFGGTNAFKLAEAALTSQHSIDTSTTIAGAGQHTFSVYGFAVERSWMWLFQNAASGVGVFFDLANGVTGAVSGTLDDYGIEAVSGAPGWYRCWITDTLVAPGTSRIGISTASGTFAYAGTAGNGIRIFGAMINEGGIAAYNSTGS